MLVGNSDPREENTAQNESLCQRESPPTTQLAVQAGPSQVLTSLKAQLGQMQLPLPFLKCMLLTLPICPSLVRMFLDNTYKKEVTDLSSFWTPALRAHLPPFLQGLPFCRLLLNGQLLETQRKRGCWIHYRDKAGPKGASRGSCVRWRNS